MTIVSTPTAPDVCFYNPYSRAHQVNPYPDYHRLRSVDPVHWCAAWNCWVLSRYDHVRMVVNDRRFGIRLDYLLTLPTLRSGLVQPFNCIIRKQILTALTPC